MNLRGAAPALMLAIAALAMAGCRDARTGHGKDSSNTAVLGGYGPHTAGPAPPLTDARGEVIPPPPAPPKAQPRVVRSADEAALAVWVADQHVVASAWARGSGWSAPQPLERIYGESSTPEIASNGQGAAIALWHHRVGSIHSLRFSRFDAATGWSVPDVVPGALPRPGGSTGPQLDMDAQGNVTARWTSGFEANQQQVARYTAAQGWSAAASEPVASAQGATPPASASR